MQVYKIYMIQYSSILPYYVKVDHNLTFINSMTLPKHVVSQRRTENKGIIMMLLVETNLAMLKAIQIMMQTSFKGFSGIKIEN